MSESNKSLEFVQAAKEKGAQDATVVLLLREAGVSESQANHLLAKHYSAELGLEMPERERSSASHPLDAFLYIFASGTLISWVSAIISLMNAYIDLNYGQGQTLDRYPANPSNAMSYGLAALLVTVPIYIVLMIVLHRRLRQGVTGYASPVRLWVLSGTLLVGVATILGFLVASIGDFFAGKAALSSNLKSGFTLLVVTGLVAYYVSWLRSKDPSEKKE